LKGSRILIVSNGFYEWKQENEGKQPYRFQLESRGSFGFAGLYDIWRNEKGTEIRSSTIITTKPNRLVEEVHDRMPVILTGDTACKWLDPDLSETRHVLEFLHPYPADQMIKYPVSKDVGNVKNSSASLIEEIPLNSE